MMSHVLETYFPGAPNTPLQDRWFEGLLRTVIEATPRALTNPNSYEARETLMYCSTMALNQFVSIGTLGDWAAHSMEHAVSAVYDIPHGGGLAILFPHWMHYCLESKPERFVQLAMRVFDVASGGGTDSEVGLEGIERLRAFWAGIGAPSRLADYQLDADQIEVMAEKATPNGPIGRTRRLSKEDVAEIYRLLL